MKRIQEGRQYTVNGITFKFIKGEKEAPKPPKLDLASAIPSLYPSLLRRTAERAVTDEENVEDVLHEVLVQELAKDRKGINDYVKYLSLSALRRYRRSFKNMERMVPFNTLGDEATVKIQEERPGKDLPVPEDAAVRELGRLAWAELEYLPLRQRFVLHKWCCGLTIGEIATELETSAGTVRFHKHAAIQTVRDRLGLKIEESA